jgi:NTP pyrophosphatase (non-canonical NTP hydrolase)
MDFDELAKEVYLINKEKEFWVDKEINYDFIGLKLALIHSEVTEVLESFRKNQGKEVAELADIIIRVLDLYRGLLEAGWVDESLHDMVYSNIDNNKKRPKKHGNMF